MALGHWLARGPERLLLGEIDDLERRFPTPEEMTRAGDKPPVVSESCVPNYDTGVSNERGQRCSEILLT